MPPTKVKIQFDDGQGGHYSIVLGGNVTKDKVTKIMDIYNLLETSEGNTEKLIPDLDTLYNRILNLIKSQFKDKQFTSYDIQEAYEDEYNEPIKLAAISTYLARFSAHGHVNRHKEGRLWIYAIHPLEQNSNKILPKNINNH